MRFRLINALGLALLINAAVAQDDRCLSWQDMLAEESISNIGIGGPGGREGILVSFIYINPPGLGECVVGEDAYGRLKETTLQKNIHGFWVGASGQYASVFKPKDYYLVQADTKLSLAAEPAPTTPSVVAGAPNSRAQYLVFFEGELNFDDPITIFFQRGDATYSAEYWLDEKYLR